MHPSTASFAFFRTSAFLSQIFAYKYGKQAVISSFGMVFGGINGNLSANHPHSSMRNNGLPDFNASAIISPSKKSLQPPCSSHVLMHVSAAARMNGLLSPKPIRNPGNRVRACLLQGEPIASAICLQISIAVLAMFALLSFNRWARAVGKSPMDGLMNFASFSIPEIFNCYI